MPFHPESQADYEDRMAGAPLLHIDTSYRGLEGRGGEIYPDSVRESMYKGKVELPAIPEMPDNPSTTQIIQYYLATYAQLVGAGVARRTARFRVDLQMVENQEHLAVTMPVNTATDNDVRIDAALQSTDAFSSTV